MNGRSNLPQVFCSGFSAVPTPASVGAVCDFLKGGIVLRGTKTQGAGRRGVAHEGM